jgi:hypothetical protein
MASSARLRLGMSEEVIEALRSSINDADEDLLLTAAEAADNVEVGQEFDTTLTGLLAVLGQRSPASRTRRRRVVRLPAGLGQRHRAVASVPRGSEPIGVIFGASCHTLALAAARRTGQLYDKYIADEGSTEDHD